MKKWFLILFFSFQFSVFSVSATLARNKVIIDNFNWQISETDHFFVYYYKKSKPVLPLAEHYLEKAYLEVARDFDFEIKEKTPFFFYLTHNEFEQTNIVDVDEGTGGVAEAYKNRFLIPYSGSEKELEHVVTHEFTHVMTFNIFYGSGFWKSLRLLKTPLYPLWLMEGIAEYEGGKNDVTTREMYIRDAVKNKQVLPLFQLHNFAHLKPHQVVLAYKESESALHFLAEEYGEEKVPDLFFEFQNRFDISSVLLRVIGLDLISFDKKWQEYLEDKYEKEITERKEPEFYGQKLTSSPLSGRLYDFNTNAVWSPDGKKIAFFSDRNGDTELYLMDKDGKKLKLLVGLKDREKIDVLHRNYTFYLGGNDLSFSPDGNYLVFAGEKNQRDYLYIYNLKKRKLKKIKIDLDTLSQPTFSPDGKNIVFVGMKDGVNNLYLFDLDNGKVSQLNNDGNDDRAPCFSPDGKWIVFSQERNKQYDLYLLNFETKEIRLLTNLPADEIMPSFSPDARKVIFVSDKNGIYNLYLTDIEGKQIQQLTRVNGGVFTPQFSSDGKEILFTGFSKGEMHIYCGKTENFGLEFQPFEATQYPEMVASTLEKVERRSLVRANYPYRFRASTDLFFPVFYISTVGGFISSYWQISEMLGDHQLATSFTYSEPGATLEYELSYFYRRWRPQLGLSTLGLNYTDGDVRKQLRGYSLQVIYPFDRFNRTEVGGITYGIKERGPLESSFKRLNLGSLSLIRDTLEGKYLEPRLGSQINISYLGGGKIFAGDYEFNQYSLYYQKFFPLFGLKSRFHSLVFRQAAAVTTGSDQNEDLIKDNFWPSFLIRGYGQFSDFKNFALISLEFRFPIFANINYHFWYLIPDFFFKYLGGVIFTDVGYLWQDKQELKNLHTKDLKNSVGLGLRLNIFILETYPLTLGLDWAKCTDSKKSRWHFYIGPTFYLDVAFGVAKRR